MAGVTPLEQSSRVDAPSVDKKNIPFVPRAELEPEVIPLSEDPAIEPVHSEDYISFARTGLQYRIRQKLRRGEIAISAQLDMHGLTVAQAKLALQQFLAKAIREHYRCICIIHGKAARIEDNRPILKNNVNQWLRGYPGVLAFCSAKPAHGGVGAVYVLLKADNSR